MAVATAAKAKVAGIEHALKNRQGDEPEQKAQRLPDELYGPTADCFFLERVHCVAIANDRKRSRSARAAGFVWYASVRSSFVALPHPLQPDFAPP
jgi:hypothetical protein